MFHDIQGFCPACGNRTLHIESGAGIIHCLTPQCPDSGAANKILADGEIHHIVRFDEHGYFNVKHPLRERINGQLLDCHVHAVVNTEGDRHHGKGTWRVKYESTWLKNPEFGGDPFSWEQIDD